MRTVFTLNVLYYKYPNGSIPTLLKTPLAQQARMSIVPFISRFGLAAPLQPALQLWCCTGSGKCVVDRCRIFAQHPVSVPVRLKTLHKGFHRYLYHILATCALEEGKRKTNTISALEKHKEGLLVSTPEP